VFINIIIKSKNKNSLKLFFKASQRIFRIKKLKCYKKTVFFQKKRAKKLFTILKSPHVNKTAQEQFQFNLFSRNLRMKAYRISKVLVVLKKLQSVCFADIQIKIKFHIDPVINSNLWLYDFDPLNRRYFPSLKLSRDHFRSYLLLFNAFGRNCFKSCLNSSVGRAKD
jgi:ribosomal protein S10